MPRFLQIALLCAAIVPLAASLSACNPPPPPQHPELLDENAAFPNLADVPPRPATMAPTQREQIKQELQQHNQTLQADPAP